MRTASGLEFDVMLESKAKDLALILLRPDTRYAEDVASRFGLTPTQAPALESEQAALLEEQAASGTESPAVRTVMPDALSGHEGCEYCRRSGA